MSHFDDQLAKVRNDTGFIAALDQSGGSTPKALKLYGLTEDAWSSDAGMFDLVHEMRTRIMTAPAFDGKRILGAILFEDTMDREVAGQPSAHYLWRTKGVVPFLKVDRGLADVYDSVQLMKPIPGLGDLLSRAKAADVFGTKMRSVIKEANPDGIRAIVEQQFNIGLEILEAGLVPIIEPEVDIHCPRKGAAEAQLRAGILAALEGIPSDRQIMLKLTIPDEDGFYDDLIGHPRVLRVVALSGGYSRDEANEKLARNPGLIASFSRALTEGLTAQQSDEEFNAALDRAIQSIYDASAT